MRENHTDTPNAVSFSKRRRFRIGGYSLLLTLAFIATAVLVNIGVKALEDRLGLRADLSYNELTRFSQQTHAVLDALDTDVVFYVLAAQGEENPLIMDVLDRYRAASRHISVQAVDPDRNPAILSRFRPEDGSTSFGANTVIVASADASRYRIYAAADLVDYAYDEQAQQWYVRAYAFERAFTQGVLHVTAERTPAVYVLQGHDEIPFAELAATQALLEDNNIAVHTLSLTDALPDAQGSVLFVLSPGKDLTEAECERIMAFLEAGGGMLYVCDVTAPNNLEVFASLQTYYGVRFLNGMVVANMSDTAQYYPQQPAFLLPALASHDITAPLVAANRQGVVIPQTRALSLPEMERADFTVRPLLLSKEGSYRIDLSDTARTSLQKQAGDVDGPFPLAVAAQRHKADADQESRVVFLGSAGTIVSGQLLSSFHNGELLISAVQWLAKDQTVNLDIVAKTAQRTALVIRSAEEYYLLGALVVVVLPLMVLVWGIIVWNRRRHL